MIIKKLIWTNSFFAIDGDGQDYYSYLIAFFIKHNAEANLANGSHVLQTATGAINVHTIGVALMTAPFFLIGYIVATIFDFPVDGVSEPFQKMITIASFFYSIVGLYILKKLFEKLRIKQLPIFLVLLSLFFGTNLIIFALGESAMAHSYSFCLMSVFVYLVYLLYQEQKHSLIPLLFIVYALIILVRPINAIIILFLPFFSFSYNDFITKTKSIFLDTKKLVVGIISFIIVLSIQSVVWYLQNGKLFQNSYSGNNFYFLNPHPLLMLFDFEAGFFIYTPLCLVILLGLIPLFFENKFKFFVWLFFLSIIVYVFSSYWGYTYFDGLGIRTFVDFYPLFGILLAVLLSKTSNKIVKVALVPLMGIAIVLNLVYCFQYKKGIIRGSGMTYEKFKYVFLKTNSAYADSIGGIHDLSPVELTKEKKLVSFFNDFNKPDFYKGNSFNFNLLQSGCGLQDYGFKTTYSKLHVKVKLNRMELVRLSSFNANLICNVTSFKNEIKTYQSYRLNDVPEKMCGKWKELNFEMNIYGDFEVNDKLSVYVDSAERQPFLIDDFKVEIYNISS